MNPPQPVEPSSPLSFDFFGVGVGVSASLGDKRDLEFFFRNFVVEGENRNLVQVELAAEGGSFFRSLLAKDNQQKSISLREADGPPLRTEFQNWSDVASPLPPFSMPTLRRRIAVIPGACLQTTSGAMQLIVGTNHAGKTALVLDHARSGGKVAADHLTILDMASGNVLPYNTPVGFRDRTLAAFRQRLNGVETRQTVSEVTGEVSLAHLDDLFEDCLSDAGRPVESIIRIGAFGKAKTSDVVRSFPPESRQRIIEMLPPVVLS